MDSEDMVMPINSKIIHGCLMLMDQERLCGNHLKKIITEVVR